MFSKNDLQKLFWLFESQPSHTYTLVNQIDGNVEGTFVGPRVAMISPWSTNAVEITQNMDIKGIIRIEAFTLMDADFEDFDPMLNQKFTTLHQAIFEPKNTPEAIKEITDVAAYNQEEGLALSEQEIEYLNRLSEKLERKLTDSEVFGFSQVNSEHCRHKIFNGVFIIDNEEKKDSLFKLIKKTSAANPNNLISAYKDNVAFLKGPTITQFAPLSPHKPSFYIEQEIKSVLSLKAETHNFPTTVEPFNGAATGSGGEIRDRLAGGQGSLPLIGTALYMTPYSRVEKGRPWESTVPERKWLYQKPVDILIKASNGASDFGNKFGQPIIAGSLFTFEHQEAGQISGYDKVVMLAGGVGYGKLEHAQKHSPKSGDQIVVLGGENYRIGMGGAAVSSADTGSFSSNIELNAVQRSNPEMQKRVTNTIRALVESDQNPIISIHDHGAGGHLNCLSELIEATGGEIYLEKLPVGDPSLSAKEILGNESQERMGLVIDPNNIKLLNDVAQRERSPMYEVGVVHDDQRFVVKNQANGQKPIDLALVDMFGNSPKQTIRDQTVHKSYEEISYNADKIEHYIRQILQLEAVACKDWLTNKVDRSVGGKVAKQQCVGVLQLPLNNVAVVALDFKGKDGVATSIGHSPITALIDPKKGSINAIAEALSNIIWAPLAGGIRSVSLSANWMWASKNPGEDTRLYNAVQACSDFAIAMGINIPTGKDSLSMKQKYADREVMAPGTLIISAAGHCSDIKKVVEPVIQPNGGDVYYINLSKDDFKLGGSSFGQIISKIGTDAPSVLDPEYFVNTFDFIQNLIINDKIQAGHDIGSGGLITSLLEICFAQPGIGLDLDFDVFEEKDLVKILFNENIGLLLQLEDEQELKKTNVEYYKIGTLLNTEQLAIRHQGNTLLLSIPEMRDTWFKTSFLLDQKQTRNQKALERFTYYKEQTLRYTFPKGFNGTLKTHTGNRPKAAIIREKGSNSEREMAHAMYLAGFDVKDVHMTDLISGREDLKDIQFIGTVGGFSNSDVLGSAKGWAGAFLYNEKAKKTLNNFFARLDTLSVGICNGCQLMMTLELIHPELPIHGKLLHNDSHKHESIFTSVTIQDNHSVMLRHMSGSTLGIWVSHGEGKFKLELPEDQYHIVAKYAYDQYPANPNGSDYGTAMMCDASGRHLVMMPHAERSIFPWNWAYYPNDRKSDEVSPWLQAFINARLWIENKA